MTSNDGQYLEPEFVLVKEERDEYFGAADDGCMSVYERETDNICGYAENENLILPSSLLQSSNISNPFDLCSSDREDHAEDSTNNDLLQHAMRLSTYEEETGHTSSVERFSRNTGISTEDVNRVETTCSEIVFESDRNVISSEGNNVEIIKTTTESISCEFCEEHFSITNKVKQELIGERGIKKLCCKSCEVRYFPTYKETGRTNIKSKENLDTSACEDSSSTIKIKTHAKILECQFCERTFSRVSLLKQHSRIHSGEKPFECKICKNKFSQNSHLKKHMKIHIGDKSFHCEICGSRFSENSSLKRHTAIHTGDQPFNCEICGYKCTLNTSLKKHMRIHSGEKPFKCKICDVNFSQDSHLKRHMKIHTGDKSFQCEICGSKFRENNSLKRHTRIHSGDRPFRCEICGYKSTLVSNLKSHIRKHTGDKPYECEFCGYECSLLSSLRVHKRIHTGDRPYECEICQIKFKQSSHLKQHLKIHTKE